jgi:integrase
MSTTRFELRKETKDKEGLCPIRLVYSVSGNRQYFPTKLKVREESWNATEQRVKYLNRTSAKKLLPHVDFNTLPSEKEVEEANGKLSKLKKDILDIEKRFELDKVGYTSETVINQLKNSNTPLEKKLGDSKEVYEFIDRYIEEYKESREPGSMTVYKSLRTHLSDFERHTKHKVRFSNIDESFFESFQNFLTSSKGTTTIKKRVKKVKDGNKNWEIELRQIPRKGISNITAAKQLSTLKTFLNYARKHGVEVSDKYRDFKIRRQRLEVIALTRKEFESLYLMDLEGNKRLSQTRDIFCFACATGLRYSDLRQLKREHIKENVIKLTVKKTKEPLTIYISPVARAILDKYETLPNPLPQISNQKLNVNIKILCEKAGVNEPIEIVRFKGNKKEATVYPKFDLIGIHTARKTFCTLALEAGSSAEQVMAVSGHRDYKSFSRYVKVTEELKQAVVANTFQIPASNKLKAV